MKKILFLFIILIPYSVFAAELTKDQACEEYSGKYEDTLQIQGFTKQAHVQGFVKKGSDLYYVVQDPKAENFYDKNYSVYSYSCLTKKVKEILPTKLLGKSMQYIQGKLFSDMHFESIKGDKITLGLYVDGTGCNEEKDDSFCDFGYYQIQFDTKKKIGKINHVYTFSPDEFVGLFRYENK